MRAYQFWILIFASSCISALLIKQIFLSRTIYYQERALTDSQVQAQTGSVYENAWKQLAIHIYRTGSKDQPLIDVLKAENVGIRNPSAETNSTSAPDTPPRAQISSKPTVAPQPSP